LPADSNLIKFINFTNTQIINPSATTITLVNKTVSGFTVGKSSNFQFYWTYSAAATYTTNINFIFNDVSVYAQNILPSVGANFVIITVPWVATVTNPAIVVQLGSEATYYSTASTDITNMTITEVQ